VKQGTGLYFDIEVLLVIPGPREQIVDTLDQLEWESFSGEAAKLPLKLDFIRRSLPSFFSLNSVPFMSL